MHSTKKPDKQEEFKSQQISPLTEDSQEPQIQSLEFKSQQTQPSLLELSKLNQTQTQEEIKQSLEEKEEGKIQPKNKRTSHKKTHKKNIIN